MHSKFKGKIKAIVEQILIAFFFTAFSVFLTSLVAGAKIEKTFALINKIAILNEISKNDKTNIKINKVKKRLVEYPSIGEVFASIKIPSISVDINVYHGDALRLLKYGVGHHPGTYFPGEGGTILIAGHNTKAQFYSLPNVKVNDEIIITAVYGTYTYKIEKTEIVEAKALNESLSINDTKETLMLYTCYPVNTPGFKTKRFVVYANLVGESNEK